MLRQDVTTRWNSTFLMFERFLELKPFLLEMMNLEEYKAHHKVLKLVKERDWTTIANVVNVLKIFYEITLQLSHASAQCVHCTVGFPCSKKSPVVATGE